MATTTATATATAPPTPPPFRPALIVVDFQEDFCPPHGALPVPDARAIAPVINALLALPFPLRLASRDWHPPDHVSFAANHPPAVAAGGAVTIVRPASASSPSSDSPPSAAAPASYSAALWPVHCLQHSPGARLVPELHARRLHALFDKGALPAVEMYSAFYDPFGLCPSGLADLLRRERVTHVYVVGLAADFCVKATAEHALAEGYTTYIVREATRPVFPDKWPQCAQDIQAEGIQLISAEGDEVARVKALPEEPEQREYSI